MTSYPVTQHLHQQLRQSASREAPPRRFFGLRRHQRRGDFFQGFQTSPDQEAPTFFWLQTSPRDDSPRSQTSPQKSLSRLEVSKKKHEFFLRQKSQKHENCPPASFCRCFMKEIAMRNHMSAFSSKKTHRLYEKTI